ncbi:unnamed protein product [Bubo scandiacus]
MYLKRQGQKLVSQTERHFTSFRANGLWVAVSTGLLEAEDGKIHLESQCWPAEEGNSQLG